MKKMRTAKSPAKEVSMRAEYHFDYAKAKPNRFAGRVNKKQIIVMLDADVGKVFTTPQSVNKALRALIAAMPKSLSKRKSAHR